MTYTMSPKAKFLYNKRIKERNRVIGFSIMVFFICLNLLAAIIFWPMLSKHMKAIKAGEKETLIQIRTD